jgi:acetyl esterase/lipase
MALPTLPSGDDFSDTASDVHVEQNVVYAHSTEGRLTGTLYRPASRGGVLPAIVAVHGGGWRRASSSYDILGPWLAREGYVVFAPRYRLATADRPRYPDAVHDVCAAVQFIKGRAKELNVDPERVAIIGDSAGGHLAALVALAGDAPSFRESQEAREFSDISTRVKVAAPVYGIYDLAQHWRNDQLTRPHEQPVERFLGRSLIEDRHIYFDASPLSYVTRRQQAPDFLLVWGTEDDIVDPRTQSLPFLEALKQSGFYVRTVVVPGAPHFWISDPLEEPGSYSAFLAPRLLRFLQARL